MTDILAEVLTAVASATGRDRDTLTNQTIIEVLELDSLDEVEILMFLEDKFDVEFDRVQVNGCKTLGDLAELVTKNKKQE